MEKIEIAKNELLHESALQVIEGLKGLILRDSENADTKSVKSCEDIVEICKDMVGLKKEYFKCVYLNSRNNVISIETISIGILNNSIIHPRELFKPAIVLSSAAVILVHNHPSGDSEPSEDDLGITKRLVEAGKILGIEVVDHIIVAKKGFFSFKEKNLI